MPGFRAFDRTELSYDVVGHGNPVVCLPGGPMQASAYLGDLGGLSRRVRLVRFDLRGTGRSQAPEDATSYRCERLADDVEALRVHLGLDRIDVLAHSAGANLAELYAIRYPGRVRKLVLVAPSTLGAGIFPDGDARRAIIRRRAGEPWHRQVSDAFETVIAGNATDSDWEALAPFTYGRWDEAARRHHASQRRNDEAAAVYTASYSPATTRAALPSVAVPVLVLAGELDLSGPPCALAELAGLFPAARIVTQAGGGHFPWLDSPAEFTETVANFLAA
ncbi:alpha/beta fold hydrolase [Amycolatopsis sp. CA-230715]|uniref:alpha/beta fold hydrolase n=1 Tax=Amycolatopsis sp. CA-230715 TaxID=2745196 RepID=UPI001C024498|nr:alpha/beta hydrolase [Amycolatopsis sp. CA-230715]